MLCQVRDIRSSTFGLLKQVTTRPPKTPFFFAFLAAASHISVVQSAAALRDYERDRDLLVCPLRFHAVGLSGTTFALDEVGIVQFMSSPRGTELLNMSNFHTNIALVAEEDLEKVIATLRVAHTGGMGSPGGGLPVQRR